MQAFRRIVTTAALSTALASAPWAAQSFADVSAPRSLASLTASQILAAAQNAARTAWNFVASCSTAIPTQGVSGTTVTHISPSIGYQTITSTVKGLGTGRVQTVFVGNVAYFKADAIGLEIQLNAQNAKWANKWISVAKGQKYYSTIASGMTTASGITQFSPARPLRKSGVVMFNKTSVVDVTGSAATAWQAGSGSGVLSVSTKSPNLPVAIVISTKLSGHALHGLCSFSGWKVKFTVAKPASSTPIAKTDL